MAKFRKPTARKQGLKFLIYGENGSGKSWFDLTFPKNAIIDSESKIGVNENNPKFKDNIVAIADTSNYYDVIDLMKEVIKHPDLYSTLSIDSYTRIYDDIQVACMEVEEERARKKKGEVDDATLSMRSYGKVKLNVLRFEDYVAQASAKGVTVVAVAHKDDVFEGDGNNRHKVGEKPVLRKNSEHTFDVVLRFFKEKDIATGEIGYAAIVEKDTTNTYKVGTKLSNVTFDSFKGYIDENSKEKTIESSYDTNIDSNIDSMKKEQEDHDTIVKEFKDLYKELSKVEGNKAKIVAIIKKHNAEKYNDPAVTPQLKKVIEELKKL
jgi:hypothetical protein